MTLPKQGDSPLYRSALWACYQLTGEDTSGTEASREDWREDAIVAVGQMRLEREWLSDVLQEIYDNVPLGAEVEARALAALNYEDPKAVA